MIFHVLTHLAAEDVDLSSHVLCDVNDGCGRPVGGDGRDPARLLLGTNQRVAVRSCEKGEGGGRGEKVWGNILIYQVCTSLAGHTPFCKGCD